MDGVVIYKLILIYPRLASACLCGCRSRLPSHMVISVASASVSSKLTWLSAHTVIIYTITSASASGKFYFRPPPPPVFQYLPFQGGTSAVVPYCYLFLLSVFILWFTYYVSDIF